MTDLPARPAQRLRKPSWRDTRLLAGILLVLLATVLGSVLVARADDRVPVYAAATSLVPGDRLTADKVTRVDVQLGDGMAGYLSASAALPEGAFVLREVRAGELVPRTALGDAASAGVQPVTVQVAASSATGLVRGSVFDVYVNTPKAGTTDAYAGPVRLLESVAVAADPAQATGFGSAGSDTVALTVMVPTAKVGELVGHLDDRSKITVVRAPGSIVRSDS